MRFSVIFLFLFFPFVFFAQNDLGCYTDTIRKTIEIFDAPKIDAGPDLFVINDGSVKINATATGRIVSYSWTPASYLSATNILQPIVVNPQTENGSLKRAIALAKRLKTHKQLANLDLILMVEISC